MIERAFDYVDEVGQQRRYAAERTASLSRATLARQGDLDGAVARLWRHVAVPGRRGGLYRASGELYAGPSMSLGASTAWWLPGTPSLRYRQAERVDGYDGVVLVPATADRRLVEELVWTATGFESVGRRGHRWVADVLYAAIAQGLVPVRPTAEVEQVAGRMMAHLTRVELRDHAVGVRRLLEMPAARWSDRDDDDAIHGRRMTQRR